MPAPPAPGIERILCPPNALLTRAAEGIVERERANLPDLTRAVVLIPDLHAAPDVAQALRAAANLPAVLLPRITTLSQWATEVAPTGRSPARREALLYRTRQARLAQSADLGQ
jgi:hypothetical protein